MKLIEIINARNVIDEISDSKDIGTHLGYAMAKFIVTTQTDAEFYSKEVQKLFDKYGEASEDGKTIIKPENIDAFSHDVQALQNTEADDPKIRFSLSELMKGLKLSMKQIYALMQFIIEDES